MAKKRLSRSDVVTFREVQNEYLLRGTEGVQALFDNKLASRATLRRAVVELKADDAERAADLERWYVNNIGQLGKGRTPPQDGDLRSFKVQQLTGGVPFARLPLPWCDKGQAILVRYDGKNVQIDTDTR